MIQPDAITELERIAANITEQDLRMMISVGGAAAVNDFIQTFINQRVEYLKHQQEAA